jgi:hypothetical protein
MSAHQMPSFHHSLLSGLSELGEYVAPWSEGPSYPAWVSAAGLVSSARGAAFAPSVVPTAGWTVFGGGTGWLSLELGTVESDDSSRKSQLPPGGFAVEASASETVGGTLAALAFTAAPGAAM